MFCKEESHAVIRSAGGVLAREGMETILKEMLWKNIGGNDEGGKYENDVIELLRKGILRAGFHILAKLSKKRSKDITEWILDDLIKPNFLHIGGICR